ncbi:MAG: hypothetical protein R3C24_14950 [Cyanobacteriota/Melainabacteria group bacterium]
MLPADCKLVTSGNWNCPGWWGGKDATGIEAIELGHPVVVLSDWAVYTVTANGAVKVAVVKFRPTAERVATLIPNGSLKKRFIFCWIKSSVSRQKTKGPMALLQECSHCRLHAQGQSHISSLGYGRPHNSRAEVDAGLKKWSSGAAAYKKKPVSRAAQVISTC